MKTPTFETSIGTVRMSIEGPDWLAVETAGLFVSPDQPELEHLGRWPFVYVPLVRRAGQWELDKSEDYPFLHTGLKTEVPVPPALIDELVTLGKEWAAAHLQEFKITYDREQYEWHCGLVKDTYAQAIADLEQAQKDLIGTLAEPDFKRLASAGLRRRVEDGANMLRTIKQQVRAALDAMADASGEVSKCLVKEVA